MNDISCILAGTVRIILPLLLFIFWKKKTSASIIPAAAALAVCFPVFLAAGFIRMGFSQDNIISYSVMQGMLYGIFEETIKYIMFRFVLSSYENRRDAVSYGIGHSAYESFGGGLACLGLTGTGRAASDILIFNLLSTLHGIVFSVTLTVLIMYGIKKNKSKITLPAAILIHFISNASAGMFIESVYAVIWILLDAGLCYAAFYFWKRMSEYES